MNTEFWDLVTMPTEFAAQLWCVPVAEIRRRRRLVTGQSRRIAKPWSKAIGLWGGVATASEIGGYLELTRAAVTGYAKTMGLKTRTAKRSRTHAELAVLLWCDRARPGRESCREHGVLLAERTLLCGHLETLMRRHEAPIGEVLDWTGRELEARWEACSFVTSPPSGVAWLLVPREGSRFTSAVGGCSREAE